MKSHKIKTYIQTLQINRKVQLVSLCICITLLFVTVYVVQQVQEMRSRAKVTTGDELFTVTDREGNAMDHTEENVWKVNTPEVQLVFSALAEPLPAVTNVSTYCGPTTNQNVELGLEVRWNPTPDAIGYKVHIQSPQGDERSEDSDGSRYLQKADYEATYTVSVQNVSKAGLYSDDSESASTECPPPPQKDEEQGNNMGASKLIIWPN